MKTRESREGTEVCLIQLMFESRVEKFWQHQDVIYDFEVEIHGTGSRSCY